MKPRVCHLDFETFSDLDVRKVGAYRYAEDPSTEILIACWAVNDGPVHTWLPHRDGMLPPEMLQELAEDEQTLFCAHNAEFERQIWHKVLERQIGRALTRGLAISLDRWRCTAARAAAAGLPRSLDNATRALDLAHKKDKAGTALIRFFCKPKKATKRNPTIRNLPEDHADKFAAFIKYCQGDVRAERALEKAIPPLGPEQQVYEHNCLINDRGIPVDIPSIEASTVVVKALTDELADEARTITGGINPTQRDKLLHWLHAQGVTLQGLKLKDVESAMKRKDLPKKARRVLELRLELGKAAPKKLVSMTALACTDSRVRGTLLYYGAHTGRLSGRLVQPHNFKRGLLKPDEYRRVLTLFRSGDPELVKIFYDDALDRLSQCMRGFIRAPAGHKLLVSDYSAIEARVLAWFAGEHRLLQMFKDGVDTYKAMASVLYGVPIDQVTDEQRRIGKNLRLGAGYQLGPPKFVVYCENAGITITQEFAEDAIYAFRKDSKKTVEYWYEIEDCAKEAVLTGRRMVLHERVQFETWREWLLMTLPSGRPIRYYAPQVDTVIKFGKAKRQLSYMGKGKANPWMRISTYGGKLTENAVQGAARDVLVKGMRNADDDDMPVVLNVHDEIVSVVGLESPRTHQDLSVSLVRMDKWTRGLPLEAKGFECEFYRKG